MAVQVAGLIAVIVFYVLILATGIFAGRKTAKSTKSEDILLANRSIGPFMSFFTLAATMVGGGYINGSAEMMYNRGLVWTQAPIGYNFALIIAGLLFAPTVRRANYVTIFDPFQQKYGTKMGTLLFLPQLLGDLFWSASILSALGASLSIILDMNDTLAIIISACVAIVYTFFGGLYSVAYTDVIQMICIFVFLFIAFPFALTSDAVDLDRLSLESWRGNVQSSEIGVYIDSFLLLVMGGIPWQVYYQRVLACRNANVARWSSVAGGVAAAIQAIPPVAMGVAAAAADWNQTSYSGPIPIPESMTSLILPLSLQYLCPTWVSVIGLGAVSAAVMSSADSCILSTGSVFTWNVYKNIFRPQASDREMIWVLRIAIVIVGVLGTIVAIFVKSIYALFFLCSDLMYVINFPQLVCVLWVTMTNTYGYLAGYIVGLILRVGGGEPYLGLPACIHYPGYDSETGQTFPFRSFAMITSFISIVLVSFVTNFLFRKNILPKRMDFLKCVTNVDIVPKKPNRDNDKGRNSSDNKEEVMPLSSL